MRRNIKELAKYSVNEPLFVQRCQARIFNIFVTNIDPRGQAYKKKNKGKK